MPSEARPKKIVEKLNRAQKCSILGPQNLGSRGGPRAPPLDLRLTDLFGLGPTVDSTRPLSSLFIREAVGKNATDSTYRTSPHHKDQ